MAGSKKSTAVSSQTYRNPHETLGGLSRFFLDGFKQQGVDQGLKQVGSDVLKNVGLKEYESPASGEMKPGQEVDLRSVKSEKAQKAPEVLSGIDYRREVVQGVQMRRSREQMEMDQKLNEIMQELKRLVSSTQILSNEYASLIVDTSPTKAGVYHVNFFTFMLNIIRTARQKVEDSGAWMAIAKKKNGYHKKSQSLGTKFTLSSERSTATQTG